VTPIEKIGIVVPVYNDWESLNILLSEISRLASGLITELIAVDDGSEQNGLDCFAPSVGLEGIQVKIIRLACNLGHQRAIAVGLSFAAEQDYDAVIVMDGDGEDRPSDIAALLEARRSSPEAVIVAQRARRSEGNVFNAGYFLYKGLFRLLTGKKIDFGNFCLIPRRAVPGKITHS
jgi:glycosyltransferase involved in cell wall biosynthesis